MDEHTLLLNQENYMILNGESIQKLKVVVNKGIKI